MKKCPKCGKEYADISAVSRSKFFDEICPECGIREALTNAGIKPDKQSEILAVIRECSR